jgi:hypothetical protein
MYYLGKDSKSGFYLFDPMRDPITIDAGSLLIFKVQGPLISCLYSYFTSYGDIET